MAGGKRVDTLLLRPVTELGYYRDIAVLAFPSFKNGKPVGFSDWQLLNNSVLIIEGRSVYKRMTKNKLFAWKILLT